VHAHIVRLLRLSAGSLRIRAAGRDIHPRTGAGGPFCDPTLRFHIMIANDSPRLWSAPSRVEPVPALCGAPLDRDDLCDGSVPFHSHHFPNNAVSNPSTFDLAPPLASATAEPISPGPVIGRPRQWTASRSRKLARLYLYSKLPIEKIIRLLEHDSFRPRCGSVRIRGKPVD
jgi:hypothetical protein